MNRVVSRITARLSLERTLKKDARVRHLTLGKLGKSDIRQRESTFMLFHYISWDFALKI